MYFRTEQLYHKLWILTKTSASVEIGGFIGGGWLKSNVSTVNLILVLDGSD